MTGTRDWRGPGMRDLASVLPSLGLLAFLLQRATAWQAGHRELAVAAVAVVLTQVLPGVLLWRLARPRAGWWVEDLAMGFAVGAALAVPTQVVTAATSERFVGWLVPLIVVALSMGVPTARRRILDAQTSALPLSWGVPVGLAALVPAYSALVAFRQPLRWNGWATQYVDLPYHLALAGRALHEFPPHYPQIGLEPLAYHWFSHAWVAQISATSGTDLDVVLIRLMPAIMAAVVPLVAAVAAMRVTRKTWAGPIAAVGTFGVAQFDVWGVLRMDGHILPLSPSQSFASLLLPAVVALLAMRWRREADGRAASLLLLLLLVVAGGAKGSVLPVLVVALGVAAGAALVGRIPERRRVAGDFATAVVVLLLLMTVMFRGGDGGMVFRPFVGLGRLWGRAFLPPDAVREGALAASMVALVLIALFAVPVFAWLLMLARRRRDPVVWLLAGFGAAGAGALIVFHHPGSSQWYFVITALVPLGFLVAWALAEYLEGAARPGLTLTAATVAGAGVVLLTRAWPGRLIDSPRPALDIWIGILEFVLVFGALAAGFGLIATRSQPSRRGATILAFALAGPAFAGIVPAVELLQRGLPVPAETDRRTVGAVHHSQVRAARWIRDHSEPGDLVMTNRHCRTASARCDRAEFTIAAYSERRVILEGWAYNRRTNEEAVEAKVGLRNTEFWDPGLLALNDGFIEQPNADDHRELYELGVRWVSVDRRLAHADDLSPYAEQRLKTRLITVYELLPPGAQG